MSQELLLTLVQKYADAEEPVDVAIEILRDRVRFDGTWWHIPVRTDYQMPRRFRYHEKLVDIAEQLREKENVEVILIPS